MLNQMIQQTKELFVKQKMALQNEVTKAQTENKTAQEQLVAVSAERDKLKLRVQSEVGGLRGKVEKAEQVRRSESPSSFCFLRMFCALMRDLAAPSHDARKGAEGGMQSRHG